MLPVPYHQKLGWLCQCEKGSDLCLVCSRPLWQSQILSQKWRNFNYGIRQGLCCFIGMFSEIRPMQVRWSLCEDYRLWGQLLWRGFVQWSQSTSSQCHQALGMRSFGFPFLALWSCLTVRCVTNLQNLCQTKDMMLSRSCFSQCKLMWYCFYIKQASIKLLVSLICVALFYLLSNGRKGKGRESHFYKSKALCAQWPCVTLLFRKKEEVLATQSLPCVMWLVLNVTTRIVYDLKVIGTRFFKKGFPLHLN